MSNQEPTQGRSPSPDPADQQTVIHGPGGSTAGRPSPGDSRLGGTALGPGEFKRALVEAGLISADELDQVAASATADVIGLSRALVKAGKLTAYQAGAVAQGKAKGLLIGKYQILDKLGAGGMGVVFKARHPNTGRVVALKILPPSLTRDPDLVARFRREAEVASKIGHPNVVTVLDADEDRGVQFLVMEYVEGTDLDRLVDDCGPLPMGQAIDATIQAAKGLEAAHTQGIVHRDIKPGNLMIDPSGAVKVLDLGLARLVDAANPYGKGPGGLTQSGSYMGTVDYMAPEQAEDSRSVDRRADVYSLGCTLYFLLTGKAPFTGDSVLKRLLAHQERPAPRLRDARPEVPEALEEVYQAMMAKRPGERVATMADVAARLEACRNASGDAKEARSGLKSSAMTALKRAAPKKAERDASIFARPGGSVALAIGHDLSLEDLVMDYREEERFATLTEVPILTSLRRIKAPAPRKRSKGAGRLAVGAAALAAAVVAGFVVVPKLLAPAESEIIRDPGPTPPVATRKADDGSRTIFDGKTPGGWMLTDRRPLPASAVQADGLNPHGPGSYLIVHDQPQGDFVLDLDYKITKGCNSGVFLRVSDLKDPVNTGIEVAIDDIGGTSMTDPGALYGLVPPKVNAQKPAGQWNHMTITAEGPTIAVNLNGQDVSKINLDQWMTAGKRPDGSSHKFKNTIGKLPRSGYLGFQDHGQDCWFKDIRIRPLGSLSAALPPPAGPEPYVATAQFHGHTERIVDSLAVVPGGKQIISTSQDRTARVWDVATGRERHRLWHPASVRPVAVFPDGRRAVTGCDDGELRLWDLATGRQLRSIPRHNGRILGVAVSPDGTKILSGGDDALRLTDAESGREEVRYEGQATRIWSVAFAGGGLLVLSGSEDGAVRVGEAKGGPLAAMQGHKGLIRDLAVTPDGRRAVSAGIDGRAIYWDLDARSIIRQVKLDDRQVHGAEITPDGRRAVLALQIGESRATDYGALAVWDLDSNDPPRIGPQGPAHLGSALMPDGDVATADIPSMVRIWTPSRTIESARSLAERGQLNPALAEYEKATRARPNDARLLIERGRLLAEHGKAKDADADFASAAKMAGNPQLFVEAGWWIAGPYDPKMNDDAFQGRPVDPSKPPPPAGGEPRRWRHAPTSARDFVDLRHAFDKDDIAAYATTIVDVPSGRDILFLIGTDDVADFWHDGKHVSHVSEFSGPDSWIYTGTLHPGRNTVLARVVNQKQGHGLNLRISDDPADVGRLEVALKHWESAAAQYARAIAASPSVPDYYQVRGDALAQQGRWKEAAADFEQGAGIVPDDFWNRPRLALARLGAGDLDGARRTCEEMTRQFNPSRNSDWAIQAAVTAVAAVPGALHRPADALPMAQRSIDRSRNDPHALGRYAAILYRDGSKYQAAENYLNRAMGPNHGNGNAFEWAVYAMTLHRLKKPGDREALNKAIAQSVKDKEQLANDSGANSFLWYERVAIDHLIDEARAELGVAK